MITTLTSLKLELKLLPSRVMSLYKVFHLAQNLGRKSKCIRGRGLKLYENGLQKTSFFLYFRHLLRRMKNCKIYHVLH